MGHVRALDGFRGLAIIGVILFHYTWLSCGWAGVQIFFVLSGFLITSILLADSQLSFGAYLKRFYWRRTLRIFPLYFGYLFILSVVFLLTGTPRPFETEWPYLYTYTFNYQRLLPGFQNNAFYSHFWSLSIEEQFYLLWPALVYLLPRRAFQGLVLVLLAACPLIRALAGSALSATSQNPGYLGQAIYSLTVCQLDAFAAGAGVAVFRNHLARHEGRNFLLCSFVILAAGQVSAIVASGSPALDTSLGYPINMFRNFQHVWGYTLINIWAASLLLLACRPNLMSTVLAHPALVYVGKISYGMYVFHLILQLGARRVFGVRHSFENLAVFVAYVGAVIAISTVSYRWFESPFLRLKDKRLTATPGGVITG